MASISDWNAKAPEIGKRPAIFLLLAARERAR
jgi:hypothetical protein